MNAEEYVIRLREQVSTPAAQAGSAVAKLGLQMKLQQSAVAGLETALGNASAKLKAMGEGAGGSTNIAEFRAQQAAVASLQSQVDAAKGSLQTLGSAQGLAQQADAMDKAAAAAKKMADAEAAAAAKARAEAEKTAAAQKKKAVEDAKANELARVGTGNMMQLSRAFGRMGGPIGRAGEHIFGVGASLQKLKMSLGAAGPYVAIAIAIVAIAAAAVLAAVAIGKYALATADAARTEQLLVAGVEASSRHLAGLGAILPSIQAKTGLATQEITKLAEELDKAGVTAQRMPGELEALATATAGGASAEFITKLKAGLIATGKVLPALRGQMEKFGAIASAKLLALPQQAETLKRNFAGLFSGLKMEGFLKGLHTLVALFDKSTASGKALKFLIEKLFQPLIDGATKAFPIVERGFIIAMIWVLKLYIAMKRFEKSDTFKGIVAGLKVLGIILAVIVGLSVAVSAFLFALVAGPILVFLAAMVAMGALATWLYGEFQAAWDGIGDAINTAIAYLESISLADIGTELIMGLVNGITGAAGAVVGAVKGAVTGAIGAAKSLLQINSPSKVFKSIGASTGEGMVMGVDGSADDVKASITRMVTPPSVAKPSGRGAPAAKAAPAISFSNCTFGGDLTESKLEGWLRKILERESLSAEPAS